MNDEDLNNAVARAMGLTRSPGTRIDKNGIETPIVYWGKIEGDTLRLVTGWNPAGDWRYTGTVLEWLSQELTRRVTMSHCLDRSWHVRVEAGSYTRPRLRVKVSADTLERAICLAAVEVGKRESI